MLVIIGLIVIPYANADANMDGHFVRTHPWQVFGSIAAICVMLGGFVDYPQLIPALAIAGFIFYAAKCSPAPASNFERWLAAKPLSFWMMTWFLVQLVVLTAIGTFFRGPGWSSVWPGRS